MTKAKEAEVLDESDGFVDAEPDSFDTWKPETPGDSVEGTVERVDSVKTRHDKADETSQVLRLRVETDGNPVQIGVWLSAGLLPYLRHFLAGAYVRITYTGEEESGKPSPMKTYRVQVRSK